MTSWEEVWVARKKTREAQQELEEFQARMAAKSSLSSESEIQSMMAWERLLKQCVRTREAEQKRDEFVARMEPKRESLHRQRESLHRQSDFAFKMAATFMFLSIVAQAVAAMLS